MTVRDQITEHYMQFVHKVEDMSGNGLRTRYTVGDGRFIVEATKCYVDSKSKRNNMAIWKKNGFISKALPSYICIKTFYTDKDGHCCGLYNCTIKRREDRPGYSIDFDTLMEATPENERYLVARCIRMYEMGIENGEAV